MRSFIFSKVFFRHLGLALIAVVLVVASLNFYLSAYTNHGETVSVPDLTGFNSEQIKSVADTVDLNLLVIDSVYTDDVPKGTVADQDPKGGRSVKRGRKIYITMNAVMPQRIKMPNLIDLTFRQAKARIESYGLRLGNLEYVPDLAENAVLNQKINGRNATPGTLVIKGSRVDLVLGNGLSNALVLVPYVLNLGIDSARMAITEAYFNIGAVVFDEGTDSLSARVYRQNPPFSSNRPIPMGSTIDLFLTSDIDKISFDPSLYGAHRAYNDSLLNRNARLETE